MARLLNDLLTVVLVVAIGAAALAVYYYPELFFSASDTSTMSIKGVDTEYWRDNVRLGLMVCATIAAYIMSNSLRAGE
ncbi:hypothetical protein [Halalkalicoccus sp. NIPERK01]|uniref:hypothetical protein n=1 Tax=Halalkalicoccus sp. NIPERK01 TaxID=3053469 RepID=UPI00256EC7BF|nr:hypothetical protein [Halalkalicoccus sp. NIPERK01]MDL5363409.1 hypothetical protein [Halalkalicoccus sp. NIPERK01]